MDSRLALRVWGLPWYEGGIVLNLYEARIKGEPCTRHVVSIETRRGDGVEEVRDRVLAAVRGVLADRWVVRADGRDTIRVSRRAHRDATFLAAGCGKRGGPLLVLPLCSWGPSTAQTRARRAEVATPDGFARYRYLPTREDAVRRLQETKRFLSTTDNLPLIMHIARLNSGAICGALWRAFGPPHDIHDDWKQSFSFYFDVDIAPWVHEPRLAKPVTLLLEVSDWKGGPRIELSMPRQSATDIYLEAGEDVLPGPLREEVVVLFLGYVEDRRRRRALKSFERSYPPGYEEGRYGARGGIPFDHVPSVASRSVARGRS